MPTKIFTSDNTEVKLLSKLEAIVNDDKTVTVSITLPETNQKSYSHVLTFQEIVTLSQQIRQAIPELQG